MNAREGGWSMMELAVSITVLVLGVMGFLAGFHGAAKLDADTRDNYLINLAYRNVVAELSSSQFENLTADYGTGSGKEDFYLAPVDSTTKVLGDIVYTVPTRPQATGSIQFFPEESSPPTTWNGVAGSLDLNADGSICGGASSDYLILPTIVGITVESIQGPRTVETNLILSRPRS